MVGIVLVSHSYALANATLTLVRAMTGMEVPIAIAAGTGENHSELGTDAMEIYSAIESVNSEDGILILMDMGSAVLSAEMALDFLDESVRSKVKLCPSSFVEGAVAAGVAAKIGSSLQDVFHEASISLFQKEQHINTEEIQTETGTNNNILKEGISTTVIIPNPHGLHARPVANLIQEASKYQSEIQIKNLINGKGPVSARSMTGIIALEALKGNIIELTAQGEDAEIAIAELKDKILSGLGDDLNEKIPQKPIVNRPIHSKDSELKPMGVSKGIIIGRPIYFQSRAIKVDKISISDNEGEIYKLKSALEIADQILFEKSMAVSHESHKEQGEIFKAQAAVLKDPTLLDQCIQIINNQKTNAAYAWWKSINKAIQEYKNLTDENLQQRALDLQDLALLVLEQLGVKSEYPLQLDEEGIIITNDITPGQVTALDTEKIKGVICLENGPTSHSSILLRSRGIPAIVLAKYSPVSLQGLTSLDIIAIDGDSGQISINPNTDTLQSIINEKKIQEDKTLLEKQKSFKPAITLDGKQIDIFANVGRLEDAQIAAENGAEGIGLLRTEFMFIEREQAPTEDEQVETLRSILTPMRGKPIVIRTLDAGGDKDIPYLNMPKEDNPFLGIRAIRLCLQNPILFQQQLRSILRISSEFNVQVMFPMISVPKELEQAKSALEEAHQSLIKENIPHAWPIKTGMMIEVPSAAVMAQVFAEQVDFFSIGTNDLIQYTMAADRGNPDLQQTLGKGLNPAVISLIKHIANAAIQHKIPVAVCGESASHPELASILLGLGVNELSMNGRSIPAMKEWVRNQQFSELVKEAKQKLFIPKL